MKFKQIYVGNYGLKINDNEKVTLLSKIFISKYFYNIFFFMEGEGLICYFGKKLLLLLLLFWLNWLPLCNTMIKLKILKIKIWGRTSCTNLTLFNFLKDNKTNIRSCIINEEFPLIFFFWTFSYFILACFGSTSVGGIVNFINSKTLFLKINKQGRNIAGQIFVNRFIKFQTA